MAEWLRLPSGQAINMERVVSVSGWPHTAPGALEHASLRTCGGQLIELLGPDAAALQAYLDRVHVGERGMQPRVR